jgi:hypothetical protein
MSPRWVLWLLARGVDLARVNTVRPGRLHGRAVWVKRRRFGMAAVIAPGNVFLRLSRSRIRMFVSRARWRDWESRSFQLLHPDRSVERVRGGVALEALPGERLDQLIERGALTRAVLEATAEELRRAHGLRLAGSDTPWSHGDVHLKNVLHDAAGHRAWLIDFESPHEEGLSADERHADDLFVFLLDLGGRARGEQAPAFARAFLEAYGRAEVLRALRARLQPPRGLERALWASRSQHLPEPRLLAWLGHLREEVDRLLGS